MARKKGSRNKTRININLYTDQIEQLRELQELDDLDISCRLRKWIDEKITELHIPAQSVLEGTGNFDII
jgi:hypothetical protein